MLGALVILGGVVAACATVRARAMRQYADAQRLLEATHFADRTLSGLLSDSRTLHAGMSGGLEEWTWRLLPAENVEVSDVGLSALRLEVRRDGREVPVLTMSVFTERSGTP